MKVKSIIYNWHQNGSVSESTGAGEDFYKVVAGKNNVVEIKEFEPLNGLQKWNYLVTMEDGSASRIFNPNYVDYFKPD